MKSRKKKELFYSLILLVSMIIVYCVAVTHPTNTLARKACTSWYIVKDKAFMLSQPGKLSNDAKLPDGFTIQAGTAAKVPVLMYHYITPKQYNNERGNKSIINKEAFEDNMKYLHDEGYYTATLEELEKYVHGQITLPQKTVVITFDDGYQNNYVYAYPILKQYGFRASIFMIGSKIEQHALDFDPTKKSYLSFDEIQASADIFEFHSHTYDLHRKGFEKCGRKYSSALDVSKIKKDITKIKAAGIDSPYFAYPFGEKREPMMYLLEKNGYRMAFTVRQGFVSPGDAPMEIKRLTVTSDTQMSELLGLSNK